MHCPRCCPFRARVDGRYVCVRETPSVPEALDEQDGRSIRTDACREEVEDET